MQNLHLVSIIILLFATFLLLFSTSTATTNRRLLHQPFFQLDQPTIAQPPYPSPTSQPQPQEPKYPFSSFSPPNPTTTTQTPFFPFTPSQPPPTHQSSTTTFPANISSLIIPSSSSSHSSTHKTIKLILLILSLSLFTFLLFTSLLFILYCHRRHYRHHLKTDTLHLFPPDSTPSDTTDKKPPPPLFPRHLPTTSNSSEFLYLGTLVSPRDANNVGPALTPRKSLNPTVSYQRLGSPELHPLPPLPRQPSQFNYQNNSPENDDDYSGRNKEEEYEQEFFSPRGSTGNKLSPTPLFNDFTKSRSLDSSNSCSPSIILDSGTPSTELSSPEILLDNFPAPLPPSVIPPSSAGRARAFSASDFSCAVKLTEPPRPPPPPPHPRLCESDCGPPSLVGLSREVVNGERYSVGNSDEIGKPKLKPLHWDKMRACSDKAMVWDQLKSSSFELNEQMIETLFMVSSSSTMNAKEGVRRQIISDTSQESLVLDPKKSQNIAILLRALSVTTEEVCEALMEGNADTLGSELLESLLKMAPTKEEERKLKEFKDDDSPFKLGIAETFLKAILDIPYAFKRVQVMLYASNFESEVEYLKMSFATLECACKELKSSIMFCKLLEAVLRTGNRMNVGTNRGDAHAFKLDSLLKLVDVKGGSDGKTTLLHFVVQEIIRTEGARLSGTEKNQQSITTLQDEVEYRKIGLQIVSALSGELTNVKKAATMDADVLSNDVMKITTGINQILEVLKLNEELLGVNHNATKRFNDYMNEFLRNAESELVNLQAEEGIALSMVKELTGYFHGDSAKEDARPFRLFMVVRDFLSILDQVCKDVGKMNQRTMTSSCRQNQTPENNNNPIILRQVFPAGINETHSSSDEDSSFYLK